MSRVAAIDCGTNSIRLLIADITNGNFYEVLRTMEVVRLGQGVDQNKAFHPDAIARTLAVVEKFANPSAILSKNRQAVMVKTDTYSLKENPAILENVIYLISNKN
jgi:exopolyphosphatase/guanosine-5'-triphosphate,3'-diphosphate pyrophosphatase